MEGDVSGEVFSDEHPNFRNQMRKEIYKILPVFRNNELRYGFVFVLLMKHKGLALVLPKTSLKCHVVWDLEAKRINQQLT